VDILALLRESLAKNDLRAKGAGTRFTSGSGRAAAKKPRKTRAARTRRAA
jgi:hypothetical protein